MANTIEGFQILSNAVGPYPNGVANGYGVAYANYDVQSIHMDVQGTLDHFTVPTGSDLDGLSLLARCDATAANVGINCYYMTVGLTATASSVVFGKFVNGVGTNLATFNNVFTPTNQLVDFVCAGTNPVVLTCKINGNTVTDNIGTPVTFNDTTSPIVTGTHAGIHWFSTRTNPDCYWTNFAAFSVPAPNQGGGGGTGTGGARSVLTSPFQGGDNTLVRCAPWNMPRGDGATFNTSGGPFGNGQVFTDTQVRYESNEGYGVSVGGAGYPLVNQAAGGENHYSIYQTDGVHADEYYLYQQPGQLHYVTDVHATGVGIGWVQATQLSQLGGLLRKFDLDNVAAGGDINHCMSIALGPDFLSTGHVWPAISQDSFAGSNTGWIPYGSLLAIPSNQTQPAGCTAIEAAIWRCWQKFGVYIADCFGPISGSGHGWLGFRVEAAAAGAISGQWRGSAQGLAIGKQLRVVTNNTTDGTNSNTARPLGGPGTRLANYLATV